MPSLVMSKIRYTWLYTYFNLESVDCAVTTWKVLQKMPCTVVYLAFFLLRAKLCGCLILDCPPPAIRYQSDLRNFDINIQSIFALLNWLNTGFEYTGRFYWETLEKNSWMYFWQDCLCCAVLLTSKIIFPIGGTVYACQILSEIKSVHGQYA